MRSPALLVIAPLALACASCGGGDSDDTQPPADQTTEVAEAAPDQPGRPATFAQCMSCHQVEPGKHGVGPSLAGVFGAKAGHAEGFNYSEAMKNSGLTWDEATLDTYLTAPMQAVPGSRMAFPGLKDEAQRKEMIEYLKGL